VYSLRLAMYCTTPSGTLSGDPKARLVRLRAQQAGEECLSLRAQQAGEELLDRLPFLGDRDP
jgi:hypothetical protein